MQLLKSRLREFKLSGIYNSLEERLPYAKEKKNVVFIGNPGTGKTHLSIAIGIRALAKGYKVFFTSVSEMLQSLNQSKADNSFYQKASILLNTRTLNSG